MAGRGRLVAFEGIDGSGKTTQARLLSQRIGAVLTSEPGATALGASLRRLLLDPTLPEVEVRTEALLMAADRAQHVAEIVEPALASGRWVVTDRFSDSTLAYQGYGRGLDVGELRWIVDWAASGTVPDLVVLIDVPVPIARSRLAGQDPDRLERLDARFHESVAAGYGVLAADEPARWAVVDGVGSKEEVESRVRAALEKIGPVPVEGRA